MPLARAKARARTARPEVQWLAGIARVFCTHPACALPRLDAQRPARNAKSVVALGISLKCALLKVVASTCRRPRAQEREEEIKAKARDGAMAAKVGANLGISIRAKGAKACLHLIRGRVHHCKGAIHGP